MSTIFDLKITVQPEHIDVLNHVNNVVYVSWMQDVATAHIEALGLGLKEYVELKHAMVAVEHHIQYRKAALVTTRVQCCNIHHFLLQESLPRRGRPFILIPVKVNLPAVPLGFSAARGQ